MDTSANLVTGAGRQASTRVVVAMSGGIDSSVAALLLLEAGYRVEAVSLRLWDSVRTDRDRVCSDASDAAGIAATLGIPHETVDLREEFEARVVSPFVAAYAGGRTPNPCVACNSEFKLGRLLEWAITHGADAVATGHYARTDRSATGDWRLRRGADATRDQSYFLFELSEAQLARTLFPLGALTKREVRERARRAGLSVAGKAESQDLCFGDPAALVAARGLAGDAGDVTDEHGRVVGRHEGIEHFTVGQRRGLGIAAGAPLYVHRLDAEAARVEVASRPPRASAVVTRGWRWLGMAAAAEEILTAQIRYRHPGTPALVAAGDAERAVVRFLQPTVAAAPGQAVVVYRGDEVAGGGWIERVSEALES